MQGQYAVILIVVHCVWTNTWACSCSKGLCILLVVSSTIVLKCGSVHLQDSLPFSTALCSHLPLCNHSVNSGAAAVMHLRARKLPGLKSVTWC